jgi:hypothetical protein
LKKKTVAYELKENKCYLLRGLPAGCTADSTSDSAIAGILGIHRDTIFFANRQSLLDAFSNLTAFSLPIKIV